MRKQHTPCGVKKHPLGISDIIGFGKSGTGAIIREFATAALGALAGDDLKEVVSSVVIDEDFRILKSELAAGINGLTAGEGENLLLYMVNGELSETEMEECIEAVGPTDRNDRLAQERAERWVKLIGVLDSGAADIAGQFRNTMGGPILEVKPRWTFSNPEGWGYAVYNGGLILTTGSNVEIIGTHYGVWVT